MAICVHCAKYFQCTHTIIMLRTPNGANPEQNSFEIAFKGGESVGYSIYGVANFNNTYARSHSSTHANVHAFIHNTFIYTFIQA